MNEEKLKFGIDITNDKLFQFYAGTGKIMGFENKRCIHSLIRLLDDMRKEDEGKCQK